MATAMRDALEALASFYGPLAPPPRDLFGFVVWEILSGRALPSRRDLAWTALRRLPALTPDAMFRASKADLQEALLMLPGREERIDELRSASGHLRRHRQLEAAVTGRLAGAVRALAELPGLTPAGRVRALLFPGGHAVAPTDEGVVRVVVRLHGLDQSGPAARRRVARGLVRAECGGDLELLRRTAVLVAHHAAHACAPSTPHCGVCPLAGQCRFAAGDPRRRGGDVS
jgi:endonuclease III